MPFTYSLKPKASSFVKSNISSDSDSEEDEELNISQNLDVCSNILKGTPDLQIRTRNTYQLDSSSFNNKIQI